MSSTIITKNSSTASAVPLAGDLVKGELAVNVTDKKLYSKDNAGTVFLLASSADAANAATSATNAAASAVSAAASAVSAAESASVFGVVRVARTSNTALTSANKGNLIDITSGTFTQTFNSCASLGNSWYCYIDNNGSGDITLDPNGSETIDGLTSFIMYPGEVRLIQCDGTALRSIVLNTFSRTFTASGTFTKPPGYSVFEGLLWAGGASGGKTNSLSFGAGGGGGGSCVPFVLQSTAVGASVTVTIGAGGLAKTVESNGDVGGNSTFGSLVTSYGGGPGGGNSTSSTGGGSGGGALSAGETGISTANRGGRPANTPTSNTTIDNDGFGGGANTGSGSPGGSSTYGGASGGTSSQSAGSSLYGGGGGGGGGSGSSAGGSSVYGGNGGTGSTSGTASAGTAPGGGGGGTGTGTSGAGARGELRIWGII